MIDNIPPADLAKYDQCLTAHQAALEVLVDHYRALSLLFGDPTATVTLCGYLEDGVPHESVAGLLGTAIRRLAVTE